MPPSTRTGAWYARYICELPSIRYTLGLAVDVVDVIGGAGEIFTISLPIVRSVGYTAVLLSAVLSAACGAANPFRQYEYEEDLYLSLDGSATLYVNSSIAALNALRGTAFDTGRRL